MGKDFLDVAPGWQLASVTSFLDFLHLVIDIMRVAVLHIARWIDLIADQSRGQNEQPLALTQFATAGLEQQFADVGNVAQ